MLFAISFLSFIVEYSHGAQTQAVIPPFKQPFVTPLLPLLGKLNRIRWRKTEERWEMYSLVATLLQKAHFAESLKRIHWLRTHNGSKHHLVTSADWHCLHNRKTLTCRGGRYSSINRQDENRDVLCCIIPLRIFDHEQRKCAQVRIDALKMSKTRLWAAVGRISCFFLKEEEEIHDWYSQGRFLKLDRRKPNPPRSNPRNTSQC